MNKHAKVLFVLLFILLFSLGEAKAASVKMRVMVVNPSTTKTQTKSIKNYLPKETKLKDIVDAGGLEIDYDEEQGLFYAYKSDIELAPGETKTFELFMEDVWFIPEEKLSDVRKRTDHVLEALKNSAYFAQAELIAKTIVGRLDDIKKTQDDAGVNKAQHIAYYRDNLKIMESIEKDLAELEKILVAVGGAPNLKVIEDSNMDLKSPNTKTTWIIIFAILIFIGILGGAFYFTWQGQVKVTENIFTKEKDMSFSEFKKEGQKKQE